VRDASVRFAWAREWAVNIWQIIGSPPDSPAGACRGDTRGMLWHAVACGMRWRGAVVRPAAVACLLARVALPLHCICETTRLTATTYTYLEFSDTSKGAIPQKRLSGSEQVPSRSGWRWRRESSRSGSGLPRDASEPVHSRSEQPAAATCEEVQCGW
jgi:hypothetical protein